MFRLRAVMISDLKYAVRMLVRSPGFTITALLTVAICLGANLAIFAVINSILLRPLPFPNSDRLVTIFNTYPKAGVENDGASVTNYFERRGNIPALSSLSIFLYRPEPVGEAGSAKQERVMRVSSEFFTTLGVGLAMGRPFTEEDMADNAAVVILTDGFWRERLNADPNVLGRDLRVNGIPRTIIGVLPRDYRFLSSEARLYIAYKTGTAQRGPDARHSGGGAIQMIARLQPGATIAEAQSQIDAHNAAVEQDNPQAKMMAEAGFRSPVVSLHAHHVRSIRPTLWLMQAGVFFLLLIGAVNLTNLLLIRASSRAKEIAIRQAMGASRWRVVQQVMAETILLTLGGGLLGVLLGVWGTDLLQVLGANRLPLGADIAFDRCLALIGLVAAVVLGLVIALPIAWFTLGGHLANALQSESRTGTVSRSAQRLRHGFIVAQVALAFVLVAGAALLGLSLMKVMAVPPGFRPDHVLAGECALTWQLGKDRVPVSDRLLEAIRQQPGIAAVGTTTNVPLSGDNGKTAVSPKGFVPLPGQTRQGHYTYGINGDYFATLGIPLREGRFLTSEDSHRPERVCVVDEAFARRYWPNGGAVGQRLAVANESEEAKLFTIVGVVGAVKQAELTEAPTQGAVYLPYVHHGNSAAVFVVARTRQSPEAFAETLRKVVHTTQPEIAIDNIRAMETRIADSLIARRSPALLAGIFAGVALLLAAIGTYGVLSYAVAQRRREIGIRMALGAQRNQIGAQFLSLGLRLLAAGTLLGLIGAWLAGRAMQSILFDVPTLPVGTLLGTALVMTVVSLVACMIPARRAARVDPMIALRAE